jgi:class 3 adenylate cyclase
MAGGTMFPLRITDKQRLYHGLLLGAAILTILASAPVVQKQVLAWELDSLTIRQKWYAPQNRSAVTPISLVNIDDRTMGNATYMKAFGATFSRRAAGYAVRFFKRTTTRGVLFDTSFNGGVHYHDLSGDQFLVDSLRDTRNVSSPLIFELTGKPGGGLNTLPLAQRAALERQSIVVRGLENFPLLAQKYRYDSLVPPYPALLASPMQFFSSMGSISQARLDGSTDDALWLSRRWAPFSFYGDRAYPTIAMGAALDGFKEVQLSRTGRLSWGSRQLDLGQDGVPLIKWRGHGMDIHKPVYPEFSFADVVLSEISLECRDNPAQPICGIVKPPAQPLLDPATFRNRYVLMGFVLPNTGDEHPTIYGPKYPGVYIVANTLDNVLNNDFVRPVAPWINVLMLFVFPLFLLAAILRFRSIWISLILTVTLSGAQFMLGLYAYHHWNVWLYVVPPVLAMLATFSGAYVYQFAREHKQRQQMRYAFGKYVSPAVLQIIEKSPEKVRLSGERREMSFLFCDIRGFTNFSDRNPPEMVQALLQQYFTTMNPIVMNRYGGSINKLIGDAIMAYWGFPLENEDHAFRAVSAAMAMRDAMLNWQKEAGNIPISIGIGVNTGEAVIGNVGSEEFMDFTVIGDAVNVASRLEAVNKLYGTTVIISEATYLRVKDRISARHLGAAELKGKSLQVEIYEPIGFIESS